ncbi:MAG: DNA gyrase inhibitor YacG [Gammaproteobacteria bacterium]|nr:DNA gyrase inhibitor YacG [Gammaproteobacteria bacterium]
MSTMKKVKCPTCGTKVEWSEKSPFRPFCSDKCRLIDLGDWASENHAIPGRDGEAEWMTGGDNPEVEGNSLN